MRIGFGSGDITRIGHGLLLVLESEAVSTSLRSDLALDALEKALAACDPCWHGMTESAQSTTAPVLHCSAFLTVAVIQIRGVEAARLRRPAPQRLGRDDRHHSGLCLNRSVECCVGFARFDAHHKAVVCGTVPSTKVPSFLPPPRDRVHKQCATRR